MGRLLGCVLLLSLTSVLSAQNPDCSSAKVPGASWPRANAEALKLDAAAIAAIDADIRAGKYGYVDSMLVIRCGMLVADKSYQHDYQKIYGELAKKQSALTPTLHGPYNYYDPGWHPFYRGGELHTMQSVTKTVASVIIGVAGARGKFPSLDTPVLDFFDAAQVKHVDARKRRLTIRHLLTMTDGLEWYEDIPYDDPRNSCVIMESLEEWIPYVINQPMMEEPGRKFNYNSGATQLLSHIFKKAVGEDIQDYAARELFQPLGISEFYWKRTPTGLTDTEGGLYLRPQDLARIGYLFLRGGEWNGKRLVTAEWVKQSTAASINIVEGVDYGFKWWLPHYAENTLAWAGHGFGGQRLFVVPEQELVLVFTGWNIPENPKGTTALGRGEMVRLARRILGLKP